MNTRKDIGVIVVEEAHSKSLRELYYASLFTPFVSVVCETTEIFERKQCSNLEIVLVEPLRRTSLADCQKVTNFRIEYEYKSIKVK